MKNIIIFCIVCFSAMVINQIAYSQQNTNQNTEMLVKSNVSTPLDNNTETRKILEVAEKQIHNFIDDIPENLMIRFGFNNKEEFKKITFGNPINIYVLENNNIKSTPEWFIPIIINNEYRTFLTIIEKNGIYQAVGFGSRILAKNISETKTNSTYGLLRIYKLNLDFIINEITENQFKFLSILKSDNKKYDLVDIINLTKNN